MRFRVSHKFTDNFLCPSFHSDRHLFMSQLLQDFLLCNMHECVYSIPWCQILLLETVWSAGVSAYIFKIDRIIELISSSFFLIFRSLCYGENSLIRAALALFYVSTTCRSNVSPLSVRDTKRRSPKEFISRLCLDLRSVGGSVISYLVAPKERVYHLGDD